MAMTHVSLGPIERYLQVVWERNGSDLLLTAYNRPLVRIDGQLVPIDDEPVLDQDHVEHLVLGCLTEELKQDLRTDKEVDFSFSWNGVARFPTASSRWAASRCRCGSSRSSCPRSLSWGSRPRSSTSRTCPRGSCS